MNPARLLGGNVPFVLNVPVYDATTLVKGELVMRHASWGNEDYTYYITAYTGAATEAEDSLGILQASSADAYASKENAKLYNMASAVPSRGTGAGNNFLPAIVNPDATYFAFYDQTTAISVTTASTSTTVTITSLEDDIDGAWLYTTEGTDSAATYKGLLRYLTASASGSCTIDSAATIDTSTDVIKILPLGHRTTELNTASTGLMTSAAGSSTPGVFLDIMENWGRWASAPTHALRYWNDKGLSGLGGKLATFEAEIVQLRHCYRAVVA